MAPRSTPPPPTPSQGSAHQGRRVSVADDPFASPHATPDPFAPQTPRPTQRRKGPPIDPLMPTKQAEELKRQWARERAAQEERERREAEQQRAQAERARQLRAAYEQEAQQRAQAQAEAQRRAQAHAEAQRRAQAHAEAQRRAQAHAEAQRRAQAHAEAQRRAQAHADQARARELLHPQASSPLSAPPQPSPPPQVSAPPQSTPPPQSALIPPPQAWRSPHPPREGDADREGSQWGSQRGSQRGSQWGSQWGSQRGSQWGSQRGSQWEARSSSVANSSASLSAPQLEALLSRLERQSERVASLQQSLEELQAKQARVEARQAALEERPAPQATPQPALPPPITPPAQRGFLSRLTGGVQRLIKASRPDPLAELERSIEGFAEAIGSSPHPTAEAPTSPSTDSEQEGVSPAPIVTFGQGQDHQLKEPLSQPPAHIEVWDESSVGSTEESLEGGALEEGAFESPSLEAEASGTPPHHHDTAEEPLAPAAAQVTGPIPQFSAHAFEEQVGGITVSRGPASTQALAQEGPLYGILLQQAQLIKQHAVTLQTQGQRIAQLEASLKSQLKDLHESEARLERALKQLAKRVQRAEAKADQAQAQKGQVKSHQRRISQLEMMVEGLEGKLAVFEEQLARGGQELATDIRVSPDEGVADYTSIQEAINEAPVGAYIGLMPGVYTEPLQITKPVKLIGLGRPNEVLLQVTEETCVHLNRMGGQFEQGLSEAQEREARKRLQQHATPDNNSMPASGGLMRWVKRKLGYEPQIDDRGAFEVETGSDDVSIMGVTINSITSEVGGAPSEHAAIVIRSGHLRLEKCEVRCENGVGVLAEGESAQVTLRACRVLNTRGTSLVLRTRAVATLSGTRVLKSKESGIDAQGFTSLRLMDCELSNHQRVGVHVGFKSQLIAYQCVIAGNSFEGVWMNNQSTGSIRSCDMRGNARGPYDITPDCQVELNGNKP